jgi:hypothetical protein
VVNLSDVGTGALEARIVLIGRRWFLAIVIVHQDGRPAVLYQCLRNCEKSSRLTDVVPLNCITSLLVASWRESENVKVISRVSVWVIGLPYAGPA